MTITPSPVVRPFRDAVAAHSAEIHVLAAIRVKRPSSPDSPPDGWYRWARVDTSVPATPRGIWPGHARLVDSPASNCADPPPELAGWYDGRLLSAGTTRKATPASRYGTGDPFEVQTVRLTLADPDGALYRKDAWNHAECVVLLQPASAAFACQIVFVGRVAAASWEDGRMILDAVDLAESALAQSNNITVVSNDLFPWASAPVTGRVLPVVYGLHLLTRTTGTPDDPESGGLDLVPLAGNHPDDRQRGRIWGVASHRAGVLRIWYRTTSNGRYAQIPREDVTVLYRLTAGTGYTLVEFPPGYLLPDGTTLAAYTGSLIAEVTGKPAGNQVDGPVMDNLLDILRDFLLSHTTILEEVALLPAIAAPDPPGPPEGRLFPDTEDSVRAMLAQLRVRAGGVVGVGKRADEIHPRDVLRDMARSWLLRLVPAAPRRSTSADADSDRRWAGLWELALADAPLTRLHTMMDSLSDGASSEARGITWRLDDINDIIDSTLTLTTESDLQTTMLAYRWNQTRGGGGSAAFRDTGTVRHAHLVVPVNAVDETGVILNRWDLPWVVEGAGALAALLLWRHAFAREVVSITTSLAQTMREPGHAALLRHGRWRMGLHDPYHPLFPVSPVARGRKVVLLASETNLDQGSVTLDLLDAESLWSDRPLRLGDELDLPEAWQDADALSRRFGALGDELEGTFIGTFPVDILFQLSIG